MPKFQVVYTDHGERKEEFLDAELCQFQPPSTLVFITPGAVKGPGGQQKVTMNAVYTSVISCKELTNGPTLLPH